MNNQEANRNERDGKPQQVYLTSEAEVLARLLGLLRALSGLETAANTGDRLARTADGALVVKDFIKRFLKGCLDEEVNQRSLDEYLRKWVPEETLFKKSILERMDTEPDCIANTFNILVRVRAERGSFVQEPLVPTDLPPDALGKGVGPIHCSAVENLASVTSTCLVLAAVEDFRDFGSVPNDAYLRLVDVIVEKEKLDKHLQVFLPTSRIVANGTTDGFEGTLLERAIQEDKCFHRTYHRLLDAHGELFPTLAAWFIDDLVERGDDGLHQRLVRDYFRHARMMDDLDIETILHDLQKNRRIRKAAVTSDRRSLKPEIHHSVIEDLDRQYTDLLETLKAYGIKADTYDQARQSFEKRVANKAKQPTADDFLEQLRKRFRHEALTELAFNSEIENMKKEFPGRESEIMQIGRRFRQEKWRNP